MNVLPVYYSHGVTKDLVLFSQVITFSLKRLDASAEIKVFMKSELELPGSSKDANLVSATCVSPKGKMSS